MCGGYSRRFVLGAGGATAALGLTSGGADAQSYRLLCSYAGGDFGDGLSQPSGYAFSELRAIQNVLQYYAPLEIYRGGVDNAAATIMQGTPLVIYNSSFLNGLARCNPAAATSVLAHEVGHHANRDTTWAGQFRHSWSRELGADFVSGVAMRRLGIRLQDALSGVMCSFGPFSPGSSSHPDSQRRLRAIQDGWRAG